MSKKQRVVADSSCYAEYIALHDSSHELVFLCQLLACLGFGPTSPTPILCDNDAARRLVEDHVGHPNVKHIRVKFHYICNLVEDSTASLTHMCLQDNTADILMKPLACTDFQRLRNYLGVGHSP